MRLIDHLLPAIAAGATLLLAATCATAQTEQQGMDAEIAGGTKQAGEAQPRGNQPIPMTARISPEVQQEIKGWGCYPSSFRVDWEQNSPGNYWSIYNMPEVQRLLFDELGMTYARVQILPRMYDAEKDDGTLDTDYIDKTLLRQLQMFKENGQEKWFISTWSPPAIMKDPPITKGRADDGSASRLREDREADFVKYYVDVLAYLRDKGVGSPVMMTIQNELSYPANWDGCVYSDEQYRRVAKMMRQELDARGFEDTIIAGPESGSYSGQLGYMGGVGFPALDEDSELNDAIGAMAFHGYGGKWSEGEWPERIRDTAIAMQKRGKDVWMTEWSLIGEYPDGVDHAVTVLQRLGRETAYIPANKWIWWQGWHRKHNGEALLEQNGPDDELAIKPLFHAFRVLWNNATPGSYVHHIESDDAELKGYDSQNVQLVAFDRPERMTVMLVNPTGTPRELTLSNVPGAKATPYVISDASPDAPAGEALAIEDQTVNLTLPARSATFLVTDAGFAAAAAAD